MYMLNPPPFLRILPLIIVGILLGNVVGLDPWRIAIAAALCSILSYGWRRKPVAELYAALSILLWAMCTTEIRAPRDISEPTQPSEYILTITSEPYTSERWQRTEATTTHLGEEAKIMLRADTCLQIALGERGSAYGYLNPLPEGSYGDLMRRRGFVGTLYLTHSVDWHPLDTLSSLTISARRIQHNLTRRIDSLDLERDERGVVKAMLLGCRNDIDPSLRESYSRSGASHILAISGLHIGIVAMVVWWLCWLLPIAGGKGHAVRNIIASVVMILYAIISGLSPSVVRATFMFVVAQIALFYGTSKSAVNTLCGTVAIMLLVNPNNLFDISFQLSVAAVIGIAIGYRPVLDFMGGRHHNLLLRTLSGIVAVGLCATIATLPLVAHTFSMVSLVGLFVNPIVILTAQIIVMGGLIWVSLPFDWLQPVARWVVGGAAELQNSVVEFAASLEWSAIECEVPMWITLVAYGAMIIGVVVATQWREKRVWKMKS